MIQERDIAILLALVRYYVLNTAQIKALVFPNLRDGRVARRRLQALADAHLLNRQNVQVCSAMNQSPPLVYYPSRGGCEFLARHFDDDKYLMTPTRTPIAHHVQHWLAVSDTHISFDAAVAKQDDVRIEGWLNEWDVANKQEADFAKHFRLYTLIRQTPKLVCVPDAAFLLSKDGHKKVHYIEQDRATSGGEQVAAQKFPGYAAMDEGRLHTRHFPESTMPSFSVLLIAPTTSRRDLLRKAMKGKPSADRWRFVAAADLRPETLLTAPIFYPCEGEPRPLIKQQEGAQHASWGVPEGIPKGVPDPVRPGTSDPKPTGRHKLIERASLGVQGARFAPLLGPLAPQPFHAFSLTIVRWAWTLALARYV